MARSSFTAQEYPECKHYKQEKVNYPVSEEVLSQMALAPNVLPIFEQKLDDYQCLRHGSLRTNAMLFCRWRNYLLNLNRERTPYMFPHNDDYHFSNYLVRYNPEESICNRKDNRIHNMQGPGFDDIGQIPISDDQHLRKTAIHVNLMAKKQEAKEDMKKKRLEKS